MSDRSAPRRGATDGPVRRDGRRHAILAFDTATSQVVVALGTARGEPLAASSWPAEHRHGEQLLPTIGRLLGESNLRRSRIDAVVVGTGPGAFTGLRVGLATAKALAVGLGRPLVGVPTAEALIAAAAEDAGVGAGRIVLLLPAGPSDRVVVRGGMPPRLLPGGEEPEAGPDDRLVAVDLDGRAPADALARGESARSRLVEVLLRLGAARLAAGRTDDPARLVPEYVSLPRGVAPTATPPEAGEVAWSRGPR